MKPDTTSELIEVMFNISRVMKEQMSFKNNLMELSVLQIQTLIYLNNTEKNSMGDIAAYLQIELPSATSLVNKLSRQKLIQRKSDKDDKRFVRITITEKGKSLLDQAIKERKGKLQNILSHLSGDEKSELLKLLSTLYLRMKD